MTTVVSINNVNYEIPLWTNALEKEFLLSDEESQSLQDRVNNAFEVLKIKDDISYLDKFYILIILREFSYGPTIEEIKSCSECKKTFNINYNIRDNIEYKLGSSVNELVINGKKIELKDSIIYKVDGAPVEELSATDYIQLSKELKNIKSTNEIKIKYNYSCPYCKTEYNIEYDEAEILNKIIKYYSISDVYKYYTNMKFNFNFSIQELDGMFVFERPIYESLFNKIIEDSQNDT